MSPPNGCKKPERMGEYWWAIGLVCAFSLATSDALLKKVLTDQDIYLVVWAKLVWFVPIGLMILTQVELVWPSPEFYGICLVAIPLEIAALLLYTKAIKSSPLGLTLPFLSLTPLFLLFIPYVMLGESVSIIGAFGIGLIAIGGYVLNISEVKHGLMGPIRAITREKGSLYMILVALIYSLTATFGKIMINATSPFMFVGLFFILSAICFSPVALHKSRYDRVKMISVLKVTFLPSLFFSMMMVTHVWGLYLTQVAYMISVKRISLLMGVIYGYYLFREKNIHERFLGAGLMLCGFILIVTG